MERFFYFVVNKHITVDILKIYTNRLFHHFISLLYEIFKKFSLLT